MQKTNINLNGQDIEISMRRSSRAKNLRIQVSIDYGVEVVAPQKMSELRIFQFIEKKKNWIINKVRYYDKFAEINKKKNELFYLGQIYKMDILNGSKNSVDFTGENFKINLRESVDLKKVLENWFRNEARINITGIITHLSHKYNLTINRIAIKEQKTRWGSCSKAGNLNFNFRLIMAPEEVIKYVVIHELTHMTHMNHSSRFWRLVSERCPDYQKHIRWLKRHGPLLRL